MARRQFANSLRAVFSDHMRPPGAEAIETVLWQRGKMCIDDLGFLTDWLPKGKRFVHARGAEWPESQAMSVHHRTSHGKSAMKVHMTRKALCLRSVFAAI